MAYRRRQGLSKSSTFKEGSRYPPEQDDATTSSAALPHTASDSRLDSYRRSGGAFHSSFKNRSKGSPTYDYSSMRSTNERGGFWGILARKAKAILEDEVPQQSRSPSRVKPETIGFSTSNQKCTGIQVQSRNESFEDLKKTGNQTLRIGSDRLTPSLNEDSKKMGSQTLRMGSDRLTPSLNQIVGGTIGNTLENRSREMKIEEKNEDPRMQFAQSQRNKESQLEASGEVRWQTISSSTSNQKDTGIQVHNRNESFEDSKKMASQTLRMGSDRLTPSLNQIVGGTIGNTLENRQREMKNKEKNEDPKMQSAQPQRNLETKLQASRDVAIATAAKVKQLMRELKTLKAELASANQRCSRLEDENKLLIGAHKTGDHPADDDMIRVQLETLLEEKGRLAHENSVYALENRYLREIVEFHQLRMQDLMYLDEDIIEVTLPITPPEADQNTLDEDIIEVTLPITPPEADQNTVEASSSSSSGSA